MFVLCHSIEPRNLNQHVLERSRHAHAHVKSDHVMYRSSWEEVSEAIRQVQGNRVEQHEEWLGALLVKLIESNGERDMQIL